MNISARLSLQKFKYNSLFTDEKSLDDEEADPLQGTQPRLPQRCTLWHTLLPYMTTFAIAALTVALFVVTVLYLRLVQETTPRQKIGCGNSIEEAEAAGCTFDMLTKSWLPAECPRYGAEEYLGASKEFNISHWQYFADLEGTTELDHQQLSLQVTKPGETSWSSTNREHITHCAWVLMRLAHVYKMGYRADDRVTDFDHTKHCTLMMLRRAMSAPNLDTVVTRGDVTFGSC